MKRTKMHEVHYILTSDARRLARALRKPREWDYQRLDQAVDASFDASDDLYDEAVAYADKFQIADIVKVRGNRVYTDAGYYYLLKACERIGSIGTISETGGLDSGPKTRYTD